MDINEIAKKITAHGLVLRSAQLKMIQEAYTALQNQQVICLEAPTGTGKTLSYGIAAYLAKQKHQTIVISTASIALQEQLIQKDLPLLSRILGVEIKAALAKGRRRYICHARLYEDNPQTDFFSKEDHGVRLRTLLENENWNGDRDQLNFTLSDTQWLAYSTDTAGCSGKLCSFYSQCAFYRAKQKWLEADFVITNHNLLLSDLALSSGVLLPAMDKSIYIVDECHHFPDKALDHFSQSTPLLSSLEWINPLLTCIQKAFQNELITSTKQKLLNIYLQDLVKALQIQQEFLQTNDITFIDNSLPEKVWRCPENHKEIFELSEQIYQESFKTLNEYQQWLSELEEKLQNSNDPEKKQQISKLIAQLGFYYSRLDKLFQTFQLFRQTRQDQEPPLARWFVKRSDNEYHCHAAPINVGKHLKKIFWEILNSGALLCSATLRAMGDFNDFRRKSGLNQLPRFKELALESCFDYQSSLLFAPKMAAAPQGMEQSAHLEEVSRLLPELFLPRSGTLVLFASKFAMEKTFAKMSTAIQADILMQGLLGKGQLLQEHRRKIQAQQRSIIFGLTSYGEGIDLPANLCQHVIIHKLPFAVPTTPIEQTRYEWLTHNQRDPFLLAALPAVSIRLAQYAGRLIRQETDRGIVSILDKRIYTKSYGLSLLKSLPAFQPLLGATLQDFKKNPLVAGLFAVK